VSAKNRYGIPGLRSEIAIISKCAFWGYVNTGKSSLINQILSDRSVSGEEPEQKATTSPFPGTTYEPVSYVFGDSLLTDIPGMIDTSSIMQWLCEKDRYRIGKTKRLHRKTLFVRKNRTVFLSGFARFDLTAERTAIIQCYYGDNITIHDTSFEKAAYIHETHMGHLLTPPYHRIPLDTITWQAHRMHVDTGEDISVNGIGWFFAAEGPIDVTISIPEGIGIEKRKGFLQNSKVRKAFSR
jgi:ribosome biogenesis GTPase A